MEPIIQRWYDMIRINSVNGHEAPMADYIAAALKGMGLTPHFSYFPEDAEAKQRPSLWTELDSGRPGKTLMLIGHIDTVDVTDGWDTDPFTPTEVGDRVYGRGAMDMKGGLVGLYYAIKALQDLGIPITKKIKLFVSGDEEPGSKTSQKHIMEEAQGCKCAFVLEPGKKNVGDIKTARLGKGGFKIIAHGKSSHSGNSPRDGISAAVELGYQIAEIIKLNDYDRESPDFFRWMVSYGRDELSGLVRERTGQDIGGILALHPLHRGPSGRLDRLEIVGTKKTIVIGKELEIRRVLSHSHLKSSAFVVDYYDRDGRPVALDGNGSPAAGFETVVLRGAGWGHGVGLCQIGAAMMAFRGYGYRDILAHYYTGAVVSRLDQQLA